MNRDLYSDAAEKSPGALVSIVVRTYAGREVFLREALESLAGQTYSPLEVIVVEDGGDQARATVETVASASRHRFVHCPLAKVGRCAAGNYGLERASGELLGFLDDDDRLLPEHVTTLVEVLKRRVDAVAAYAQAWEVPTVVQASTPLKYTERAGYQVARPPFSRAALASRNLFPIQAVLFRRKLFERFGGFDPRLDNLEDWDLWRRYATAGDFIGVERVTSIYRVPGTLRTALSRQRVLEAYRLVLDRLRQADASAETLWQTCVRRLRATARRLAIQPPIFALRWYFRNVATSERLGGRQRDSSAPTAAVSVKAAS